jgi:hypothetical protein
VATETGALSVAESVRVNDSFVCDGMIWKKRGFEVPPPGAGLVTVMLTVPASVTSDAAIIAVNFELFTNAVERGLPFQFTTNPDTNPPPVTVRVNGEAPGAVDSGLTG